MKATKMLLDYAATYPDVTIRFHASDMILHAESDAAYLVQPEAKSWIAGYFYLSTHPPSPPLIPTPPRNGPLHIVCKTLRHVVASAAEVFLRFLTRRKQYQFVIYSLNLATSNRQLL